MTSLLWILLVLLSAAIKTDAYNCPPMGACDNYFGCIEKDAHGCSICNCPKGQGVPINIPVAPRYYSQHRDRRSCPPMEPCDDFEGCVEVDDNGCRTCNCPSGQGKFIHITPAVPHSYSLHIEIKGLVDAKDTNVTDGSCPPMEPCDDIEGCVDVDDNGCRTCNCPAGQGKFINITPASPYLYYQHIESKGLVAAKDTNATDESCPPLEPCDAFEGCVDVDDKGCRTCNCPAGQGKFIHITPAAPHSYSQHIEIKKLVAAKDTNATDGSCPPMEPCDDIEGCVEVDDNGCGTCNCPSGKGKFIHITPAAPFSFSQHIESKGLVAADTNATNGSCTPMEPCDDFEGCVDVDDNDCRTCNCPAGQGKFIHITPAAPYSYSQHIDSKGLVASNDTNAINGSCPPMEPCDDFEGCVEVDDNGCRTCNCPAGQSKFIHITPAAPYSYSQHMDNKGLAAAKDTTAVDENP